MSTEQLYIPDNIKIGFQNRAGTYTGKLAYVIYTDHKGVLRKETSWKQWRDTSIDPEDYKNAPTEGFVLNKGVGGARESHGWNARNEYVRVFDPRGFEFEISVGNLLCILRECDCSRGKGLEGKFVYAWDRNNLVLLPCVSQEYQISTKYTALQAQGVAQSELVEGATYSTKKQETLIYLGQFDFFFAVHPNISKKDQKGVHKKLIFWDGEKMIARNDTKPLAVRVGDAIAPNYSELVDAYNKSAHGSKVVSLFLKEDEPEDHYYDFYYVQEGDKFIRCHAQPTYHRQPENGIDYVVDAEHQYFVRDGRLAWESVKLVPVPSGRERYGRFHDCTLVENFHLRPNTKRLFALMESGAEVRVTHDNFRG